MSRATLLKQLKKSESFLHWDLQQVQRIRRVLGIGWRIYTEWNTDTRKRHAHKSNDRRWRKIRKHQPEGINND